MLIYKLETEGLGPKGEETIALFSMSKSPFPSHEHPPSTHQEGCFPIDEPQAICM